MTQYAKLIEGNLEFAPKNKGSIINYDLDVEQMIADEYKEFVPAEIPQTNRMYHIGYDETEEVITEIIVYDETQEEADERIANEEKHIKENELDEKIQKLEIMVTDEILFENTENVQIYREIIQGLKDTKNNL